MRNKGPRYWISLYEIIYTGLICLTSTVRCVTGHVNMYFPVSPDCDVAKECMNCLLYTWPLGRAMGGLSASMSSPEPLKTENNISGTHRQRTMRCAVLRWLLLHSIGIERTNGFHAVTLACISTRRCCVTREALDAQPSRLWTGRRDSPRAVAPWPAPSRRRTPTATTTGWDCRDAHAFLWKTPSRAKIFPIPSPGRDHRHRLRWSYSSEGHLPPSPSPTCSETPRGGPPSLRLWREIGWRGVCADAGSGAPRTVPRSCWRTRGDWCWAREGPREWYPGGLAACRYRRQARVRREIRRTWSSTRRCPPVWFGPAAGECQFYLHTADH